MLPLIALVCLGHQNDPVAYSFAFFGCNRVDNKDVDPVANPSSANVPQLRQTFADVSTLEPRPKLFFAGGDIVMGYADDQGQVLKAQLDGWAKVVRPIPGTELIPLTGNHELNRKVGKDKLPSPKMDKVWTDWLDRNHFRPSRGNGPTPKGLDPVLDDQSRLTYSFNQGDIHFVVINTDTRVTLRDDATGDTKIAWIPTRWISQDVQHAQNDPKIKHIFLLGHRNMVRPESVDGDAPIDPACAAELERIVKTNKKVRAYVCAHVHAYDLKPLNGPWQITSGHGGSPLEKGWEPAGGPTFGFVVVNIHRSGTVGVVSYHRPARKDYLSEKTEAAKPDPEVIVWKP